MTINTGIKTEHLLGTTTILNQLLADEFTLYTKARKYHWNVVGIHFHDLHKLFESIYEELDGIVDEIAERTRSLGANAIGTLSEFSKLSHITEESGSYPEAKVMIQDLLNDFEHLTREIRQNITKVQDEYLDLGTADFLTGILEKHEKTAWMLRSLLQ